jgi:hypothetical protein
MFPFPLSFFLKLQKGTFFNNIGTDGKKIDQHSSCWNETTNRWTVWLFDVIWSAIWRKSLESPPDSFYVKENENVSWLKMKTKVLTIWREILDERTGHCSKGIEWFVLCYTAWNKNPTDRWSMPYRPSNERKAGVTRLKLLLYSLLVSKSDKILIKQFGIETYSFRLFLHLLVLVWGWAE